MPELPEVESVRKVLKNTLLNQKLITYKITDKRINRFNHTNEFVQFQKETEFLFNDVLNYFKKTLSIDKDKRLK